MADSPSADLCTVNNKRWRGDLPLVEWTKFDILYTFKIQNIVLTALYFSSVCLHFLTGSSTTITFLQHLFPMTRCITIGCLQTDYIELHTCSKIQ